MLYQLSYASPSHPEIAPETRKSVRTHYHYARTTAQKPRLTQRRRAEQTEAESGSHASLVVVKIEEVSIQILDRELPQSPQLLLQRIHNLRTERLQLLI